MTESLRIAVAEDEPELLDDLDEMLRAMGHQVVVRAGDGRELVDRCADADVQLVVTDVLMPKLDGLEAATEICKRRPVPVIVVSAYDDEHLVERSLTDHVLA
jgi:CheY-like chemotaxis protein